MLTAVRALNLVWYYCKTNLSIAMEYRTSFLTQVFGMILNDALWLSFWWLFFQKFRSIGDWSYTELVLLYSVVTIGFGLAYGIMGNCNQLSQLIAEGHLDFYLGLPQNVLLHILISRMDTIAWGDLFFGIIIYLLSGMVTWYNTVLLAIASILTALLFVFFGVACHSLSFYIGNANALATQLTNALLTFSMYPTNMFKGIAKVVLFTVLPAGLITWVPTALIKQHRLEILLVMAIGTGIMMLIAISLFYRGLRRYESGNLISIRI